MTFGQLYLLLVAAVSGHVHAIVVSRRQSPKDAEPQKSESFLRGNVMQHHWLNGASTVAGIHQGFYRSQSLQRVKGRRGHCGWEGAPFPPELNKTRIDARPRVVSDHMETVCQRLREDGRDSTCKMYQLAFPNTVDTTVQVLPEQTETGLNLTFISTGDIGDMWLRDSSAQVNHYLSLVRQDSFLKDVMAGLFQQQIAYYMEHPYANSFKTDGRVATNSFELDSACYAIKLGYHLWKHTGDSSVLGGDNFLQFVRAILDQWKVEQDHAGQSPYGPEQALDPYHDITGPVKPGTGLIWQAYRPSDDGCEYHYNIPGNMMAAVSLTMISEMLVSIYGDGSHSSLQAAVLDLREDIDRGIHEYGRGRAPGSHGEIYAYEVDGNGAQKFMDDANIPSLLSIPYLGYSSPLHNTTELYANTRGFVLSKDNPYYYEGAYAKGVGSPHTSPGCIWHLSLIMQGLTATSLDEKLTILEVLENTTGDTGYMHESFEADYPSTYTRGWFGWADSLFSEFVEHVLDFKEK